MSVFRVEKNKNYTMMSNYHFKEKGMSLKAKGLLSLMLSLPNDWDYTIEGLVAICKENRTSITNTLNELKDFHYLEIKKTQNSKGQFDYIYNIYEQPQDKKPDTENPYMDNLDMENPVIENQQQLNTNILNTKELNTKNKILNNKEKKESDFDILIRENFSNENLKETMYEFIKMRKTIKKPLTTRALENIIKKLYRLTTNEDEQIQIVNESITNAWQGIYPLKQEVKQKQKSGFDDFKDLWEEAKKEDEQAGNDTSNNVVGW